MEDDDGLRRKRRILWGAFLIVLGGAFLLGRAGMLEVPAVERLWPLVFLVLGLSQALERRLGSTVMFLLMGAAFMAVEFHWMGLSYHNFWPLLLIAVGAGIVVRAARKEDAARGRGEAHDA